MICSLKTNVHLLDIEDKIYRYIIRGYKRIFLYAANLKHYLTVKGVKYNDVADIIEIYLTKEDFFKKGSTVYQVRMEVVSDNNNFVEEWQPGLKVYYINTEGLTNKTINAYLSLLTDKTTLSNKYKVTSEIKKGLYEKGGEGMSSELMEIIDEGRAEGRAEGIAEERQRSIKMIVNLYNKGLIDENVAAEELGISVDEFMKKVREVYMLKNIK